MNRQPQRHVQPAAAWTESLRFARIGALIVLVLSCVVGCQRSGLPDAKELAEAKETATPTPRKNQPGPRPIERVWLVIDGVYFTGDGKGILTTFKSDPTMVLKLMPREFRHGAQRRLTLWDAATGRERWTVYEGPRFWHITCLPDGKHALMVPNNDTGKLELWDLVKGKRVRTLKTPTKGIISLALSPDGRLLLVGDENGLFLWDMEKAKLVRWHHHGPGCSADIALSLGGHYIMDNVRLGVRLWDGKTGIILSEKPRVEGWSGPFAFSPDGRLALAHWQDYRAWKENLPHKVYTVLWEVKSGKEVRRLETGGILPAFTPDGKYLVGLTGNKLVGWEVATGRRLYSVTANSKVEKGSLQDDRIEKGTISPDGALALTVVNVGSTPGEGRTYLELWRTSDGKLLRDWEVHEPWDGQ